MRKLLCILLISGSVIIAGCRSQSGLPVSRQNYPQTCHTLIVQYARGCGAAAKTVAAEIRSGKIRTNTAAKERFSELTKPVNDAKNKGWADAHAVRNPPEGDVDASAWDDAAAGFGGVR